MATRTKMIGERLFVDGVTRPVYQEPSGRQYVLDGKEKVYGVWILTSEETTEPDAVVESA